jgi:hypothetical protein
MRLPIQARANCAANGSVLDHEIDGLNLGMVDRCRGSNWHSRLFLNWMSALARARALEQTRRSRSTLAFGGAGCETIDCE